MLNTQELIDKALEIEQLEWWLKYPTLQSFHLSRCWSGDDEGSYWTEQSERIFHLTSDPYEPDDDDTYWDYDNHSDFSVSAYPCVRNGEIYERIHRPKMTDTEMQERINTILSMFNGESVTQTLGDITGSNITGLVIGDL